MADPTINGTGEGQPAADDSIRGALAAALAEREEPAEKPAPKADVAKPEPDGEAGAAPAGDGEPDAKGADKPKPDAAGEPVKGKDAEKPAKTDGEEKPEPTAAEKAETEKKTAEAAMTAKWSAKDKELLAKQPAEVKEFMLRRHKEMEVAFQKKTQEFTTFRREYEPVQNLLSPYAEQMKQHGWTPSTLISAWANVEKRLMDGDGVNVVAGLMKGYRINIAEVATALGLKPPTRPNGAADPARGEAPPPAEAGAQAAQLPPELTNQLRAIQERLDADDRARAAAQRQAANSAVEKVMTEIEQFKTAQDDKGTLLHPHFEEVEEMMTALAQAATAARKPVPPLAQLYETAVAANPDLLEQVIAARVAAQRDKETQAARAKAEKARKASSSVTGAPGSGQAPTAKRVDQMSLREQLEAAAAEAAEA